MTDTNTTNLLPAAGGILSITAGMAAGPVLADSLRRLTGGTPIAVTKALRTEKDGLVTVAGTTALFNISQLAVTALALNGPAGAILTLRFTLIQGAPGPNPWHFSQSFPNLPDFFAGTAAGASASETQVSLLDRLILSDAAFVLTTASGTHDTVTGAPLTPGLNFVARLSPTRLLGLISASQNKLTSWCCQAA